MHARPLLRWIVWLVAAGAAAVGFRQYRVDNRLSDWVPQAATSGPFHSYCLVGFPTARASTSTVSAALRELPTVAWSVGPATVATFGSIAGVTSENFVTSPSGDFAGVYCFPRPDVSDEQLVASIRARLRSIPGVTAHDLFVGGPAVFHVELNAWSQRRLPAIVGAITLVGALLLIAVTRRPKAALAAVAALVLSQIVLVGGISWLGMPMDMSLSVVPPMMLAFGFSYASHRVLRPGIIRTLILCAATTAAGMACFAVTDLPPIRRFAISGVVGVGLVWLAVVTLVPAAPCARPGRLARGFRGAIIGLVGKAPATICLLAGLVSLATLPAAFRLRLASDPLRYFPSDARIVRDFDVLNARLTGMLPFQLVVKGDCNGEAILEGTPGIRKVINITQIVGSTDRVYWCLADNDALPGLVTARPTWEHRARQGGCTLRWTGVAAELAGISHTIARIAIVSLPLMVLLAAVVVGFLTRSIRLALLSAWVNALPVLVLIVIAGVTRWPLDLPSLMIGAIAVGMAIDDTIHVAGGLARGWSARRTLLSCWRPCAGSTLVVAVGLALFGFAPFRPTAQFGILLSAASVVALAGDLLVLPAAWRLWGRVRATTHG